jgi:Outer membrane protein beta-barrel domain
MENRSINRDFEQFVKQNADQYRMFPSEKVWKGIHNRIHTRRRWYGLALAFLLLSTGAVTWVMLVNPSSKKQSLTYTKASTPATSKQIKPEKKNAIIAPAASVKNNDVQLANTIFPTGLAIENNPSSKDTEADVANSPYGIVIENVPVKETEPEILSMPIAAVEQPALTIDKTARTRPFVKMKEAAGKIVSTTIPAEIITETAVSKPAIEKTTLPAEEEKADEKNPVNTPPLTIESVVNSFKRIGKRKKSTWQVFVTPTISYRSLRENATFIDAANRSTPLISYIPENLQSVVNHKPDIGFQVGVSSGYPLSKKFRLITGFQFNVNKYDIQAYNYSNEVATIALSLAAGRTNTVLATANYRIEGGYKAKWLRNFYFSASAPVGLEFKMAEKAKSYVGVTATVQPTYILDNKSYLVSTNYKNYVEIPSLTRKWNVNAGFEVFAGIKTGNTEIRVGPQVRYQTLSSYKNKYPIKENLFDFGLKVGVMLR